MNTALKCLHNAVIATLIFAVIPSTSAQVSSHFDTNARRLAASGPVGVRVYAQAWNPQNPAQDTPTQVLDDATAISGPMNVLWNEARAYITDRTNSRQRAGAARQGRSHCQGRHPV